MSDLSKKFALIMVSIFVVSVLFLVEPSVAPVTIPENPSTAPEIVSVKIHHNPVWCPPTYYTDSYTGEVKETIAGYWKPVGTIDITIKNRPFTPYIDKNGNSVNVYYTFFTRSSDLGVSWDVITRPRYAVYQSDSVYTIFTLRYDDSFSVDSDFLSVGGEGATVDFRVQAVTGGYFQGKPPFIDAVFDGEGSEWTEFTVTIPFSDKPGTSTVKPSSTLNPGTPSTSDSYNNSQQNVMILPTSIIILVSVCVITSLLVIVVYLLYSLQRKSKPVSTNS